MKVLINIATNEDSSRFLITKSLELGIKKFLHKNLSLENRFLFCRLFFLLSIDCEGAKMLFDSEEVENFIREALDIKQMIDNSETGKILIDILRFKYNLIRNGLSDHKM